MAQYIKTLIENDTDTIYPVTKASATYMDDGTTTVQSYVTTLNGNLANLDGNVVKTTANQGLTDAQKRNARNNIGAGAGSGVGVPTAYTIAASGWNSSTAIYSFETTYPSSRYDITEIVVNENTTDAQTVAWNNTGCNGYYTTNIIKARGEIPTIDIPVTLFIVDKEA